MNSEFISDNILAAGLQNDNLEAFELLYHRYNKRLFCFSLRYLKNSSEAEELVQAVFISVWEHRRSIDAKLSIRNYIYRSAVNYIYNFLKRRAVRNRFIQCELLKQEPLFNQVSDQVLCHDLEKTIDIIISKLPPRQQKIFSMSRLEGLSNQEISDKLNISIRTVENQIFRVLKVFRKILGSDIHTA